ncbi:hypothetical protein A2858_02700 [Candidatus Daviesbacteria bacterium RIFCSPHIGHO2_01_FULL_36_37]|uniref:Phosphoadenosine phosphosulphate reductase domain-containing protein n=2 Tax=Candidatus Daviesiibacteriota TaxID=1752718 RepID=A0A1F5IMP1_9BACT|nr:MAG: Phosphoadenosine phosphosulfate reductase [Candidatus Daviesbacteria bacterium GW2011_GWA1_36_8]OGE17632.1 MAG: hypothetical protein A2858_02700 [Candidatus Daviesbacteria bacterium RIFCSPHIGHO2_01_FULL_36_37]
MKSQKKNKDEIKKVILIICDTLRSKNVGCYNKKIKSTPNIDILSKEGILFKNPYTTITCTDPSITAIMTGNYPLTSGLINHGTYVKPDEEKNINKHFFLSEILNSNGFKTAAVDWLGRWHKRGFDYYSGKLKNDYKKSYPIAQYLPFPLIIRILDKISIKYLKREIFLRFYYALSKDPQIPYDTADLVVDKGIDILKSYQKNKLFLYLHLWDAHSPHTRPRGIASYIFNNIDDTYNSEIEFMDRQIGRLMDYLKKSGEFKNTLIVLTSDHGENLYEHDIPLNHENLKEDTVKVPLIIKHPSIKYLGISSLVQTIDIFPTILDFLKIKHFKKIDGKSLRPLINNKNKRIRSFVFFEDITYRKVNFPNNSRRRGVLYNNLKYIVTYKGPEKELRNFNPREDFITSKDEFYHLKSDSSESKNLVAHKIGYSTHKKIIAKIIQSLNYKYLAVQNPNLYKKLEKAVKIIKEANLKYGLSNIAIAWKGGKDTTVLMHIIKNIYGHIPLRVMFNDTTLEFKQTYKFINTIKNLWNLKLIIVKHDLKELEEFHNTKNDQRKKELSRLMKITAINKALKKYKFNGFMLGIRRDENPARANEKYFSKRKDHIRIHPLLDWTEKDIWEYTKFFGVPYSKLYDEGYRSIGEKEFTKKAVKGLNERSGRELEKEQLMGRLRKLGYW